MSEPFGRYTGFPEAQYHADPGVGSGGIKLLARSPASYEARNVIPFEGNDATDFGSAFHMALLQPERFSREVVILDREINFATKEGKELRSAYGPDVIFLKPKPGRILARLLSKVEPITNMLGLNPFADAGDSEVAYFWQDRGVTGKALIDRESADLPWLYDVKTTRVDLDERSLMRCALDFGWHLQAAWYRRGVGKVRGIDPSELMFVFVVFQTTAPFSARVVVVPSETMAIADRLIERALDNAAELEISIRQRSEIRDPCSGWMELKFPEWFKDEAGLS